MRNHSLELARLSLFWCASLENDRNGLAPFPPFQIVLSVKSRALGARGKEEEEHDDRATGSSFYVPSGAIIGNEGRVNGDLVAVDLKNRLRSRSPR